MNYILIEDPRAAKEAQARVPKKDVIIKRKCSWSEPAGSNNNGKNDGVRSPTHTRHSIRSIEWVCYSEDPSSSSMPTWVIPVRTMPPRFLLQGLLFFFEQFEAEMVPPPPPLIPLLPPPTSSLQSMHNILRAFASDVNRAMKHVSDLREHRNALLDERFLALAKEILATKQILQIEAQQLEAVVNEEFEVADRLQIVLGGHHREKAACSSIFSDRTQGLAQLDEQMLKAVYGVVRCFKNVARDLEELDAKQKLQDEDSSEQLEKFAITAGQLADEGERLKGEEKDLERDEEMVHTERKELEETIAKQTADIEELRGEKRKQLLLVEKEMDDLREQLRLKELQAHEIKMEMEAHNDEISKIMVQISHVPKKLSVKENRREWINKCDAHQKLKEAHEAEVKAHSETLLQRSTVADAIKTNIKMSSTFQEIISREFIFENIREEDEDKDLILAQIQADVVECEGAADEAKQIAKATETRHVSLDGESRRIQEKLPKLEDEKLKAVAKRDFKAAGRASKEIKESSIRLQELDETLIREAKKEIQEAKRSLKKAQQDLEQKQISAKEKQRELIQIAMKKIPKRINALMGMKANVSSNASHESVNKVGAMVLQCQIDALLQEEQFLRDTFDGWDENMSAFDNGDQTSHFEEHVTKKELFVDVSDRSCSEASPETLETARALMKRHAQVEKEIDTAMEKEDFAKAAELDEVLRNITDELHKLNLTDAEFDLFAVNDNEHAEVEKEDEIVHQPRSRRDVIPEDVAREIHLIMRNCGLAFLVAPKRNFFIESSFSFTRSDSDLLFVPEP